MRGLWQRLEGIRLQVILAGILLIAILTTVIVLFFPTKKAVDTGAPLKTAIPTPIPPADRLTEQESSYPDATPHPTEFATQAGKGVLIITSNITDANVIIFREDEVESHGKYEDKYSSPLPVNKTPYKNESFPAGTYMVRVVKDGYLPNEESFTVTSDVITRLNIHLIK